MNNSLLIDVTHTKCEGCSYIWHYQTYSGYISLSGVKKCCIVMTIIDYCHLVVWRVTSSYSGTVDMSWLAADCSLCGGFTCHKLFDVCLVCLRPNVENQWEGSLYKHVNA